MRRVTLDIVAAESGRTLRDVLTGRGALTADEANLALERGGVTVNRRRVRDGSSSLQVGDAVVATLAEASVTTERLENKLFVSIDAHVIVVNKPAGLAAQATAADAMAGLDTAVRKALVARGDQKTELFVVHRLDFETSGVTVLARTKKAAEQLSAQFRDSAVTKVYAALVSGVPEWDRKLVDGPIGAAARPGTFEVSSRGRPAATVFSCIEKRSGHGLAVALVEAEPKTGRTHQIRVHAASVGHPILGDPRYKGPAFVTADDGTRIDFPRVMLHARRLSFRHPDGRTMAVEAPWPEDFNEVRAALRVVTAAQGAG